MATDEVSTERVEEEATARAVDWAKRGGMFPSLLPGSRLRQFVENPEAWKYRAAKLRFHFGDEDVMTETEFTARVAAVSSVLVR